MFKNNNNTIKQITKTNKSNEQRISELENQLKQTKQQNYIMKQTNNNLLNKINEYEAKLGDYKILQDQLNFRRQEEKQLQQHIDNYQHINHKLRQRISILENKVKYYEKDIKYNHHDTKYQSIDILSEDNPNLEKNKREIRKSLGNQNSIPRENHPLTPKSRVSIDFSHLVNTQVIAKKKVFL